MTQRSSRARLSLLYEVFLNPCMGRISPNDVRFSLNYGYG